MNSFPIIRRSLPVTAALLLLAAPVFAAEPAEGPAPAAAGGEGESREALESQLEQAQQRLDASVREVERLSGRLGARMGDRFIRGPMAPPRAMLGIQVDADGDKGGAKVMAVSPGGPAEAAGLKSGDLIVSIAGKDITKADDPGRELVEAMRAQEPERKVKLRYKRDGRTHDVEVTPRAAPRTAMFRTFRDGPGRAGGAMPPMPPMPGGMPFGPGPEGRFGDGDGPGRGMGLAGMELATLSEKLGGYFGAKEGVLVVRAGRNEALKLQDGDVILKIDGRAPSSASHATRILRSYQRGEKLQMTVLRDRKTLTLDVTLPGG